MSCGRKGYVRIYLVVLIVAMVSTVLYIESYKGIYDFSLPREAVDSSWTSTQETVDSSWTSTQETVDSSWTSTQEIVDSSWTSTSTKTAGYRTVINQTPSAILTKVTLLWTETKNTEPPNKQLNDSLSPSILVLLWRPLYRQVRSVEGQMARHCPNHNCRFTSDRKYMPEADAVVFEVEGIHKLPSKTKMGQVWVYVDIESPALIGNGIKSWNNLFNWTISYRRDSDIPYFYGSLTKKNQKSNRTLRPDLFINKTGSVLWLASNCRTAGKRERFVKDLQMLTTVDVVGRCGKNVCPKGNSTCETSLMKNYKFYFAAENSNCRDYVTEKAYRAYGNYILPVVRGGGNYSLYFPPKSYIDASKFKSLKILGIHKYLRNQINYFDKSKEMFEKYISVIEQYRADIIYSQMWIPFCKLCDRLNNQSKFRRLYRNIHDWWRGRERTSGYFCRKDELVRL